MVRLEILASESSLMMGSRWGSSWLSCCCPVSRICCSFASVGLSPSHVPTVHRCGEHWGRPTRSPCSGPGRWLGCQPANFLPLSHQGGSTTLASPPSCSLKQIVGPVSLLLGLQVRLTHDHTTRASSTVLPKQGAGPTHPIAIGSLWGDQSQLPCFHTLPRGWLNCACPPPQQNRVSSSVLPRWDAGPDLLCAAAGEEQDWFPTLLGQPSCLLQVARAGRGCLSLTHITTWRRGEVVCYDQGQQSVNLGEVRRKLGSGFNMTQQPGVESNFRNLTLGSFRYI